MVVSGGILQRCAAGGRLQQTTRDRVGQFLGRPQADLWCGTSSWWRSWAFPRCGGSASLQTLLQHVAADERPMAAGAFRSAVEEGAPVLVSCRLLAADGSVRSVLITAEVSEVEPNESSMSALLRMDGFTAATGPWLVGQVVDLTALRLSATRAAANHAVVQAAKHRAAIEQAKGIIMATYRIDADAAFELLRRHSQNTNTKVHDLAAHLRQPSDDAELRDRPRPSRRPPPTTALAGTAPHTWKVLHATDGVAKAATVTPRSNSIEPARWLSRRDSRRDLGERSTPSVLLIA